MNFKHCRNAKGRLTTKCNWVKELTNQNDYLNDAPPLFIYYYSNFSIKKLFYTKSHKCIWNTKQNRVKVFHFLVINLLWNKSVEWVNRVICKWISIFNESINWFNDSFIKTTACFIHHVLEWIVLHHYTSEQQLYDFVSDLYKEYNRENVISQVAFAQ